MLILGAFLLVVSCIASAIHAVMGNTFNMSLLIIMFKLLLWMLILDEIKGIIKFRLEYA